MREMFILSKSAVYLYQVRPDKGKMVLRRTKAVTLLSTQANGRVTQHFSTLVVENGSCSQPSVRLRNYSSCSLPVFLFLALRNFLHMLIGNRLSWQGNCCSPYLLASLPCTFFHLDFPEFSALSSHLKAATVLLDISSLSLPGDATADCLYDLISKSITLLLCIAVQCMKTTVSYFLFF